MTSSRVMSRLRIGISLITVIGMGSAPAFGQTVKTASDEKEQDAGSTPGEIVVTAQRREERLSQVPLSVQAVSGELIGKASLLDVRQLGALLPTVSFTGGFNSASTSFNIRGVSTIVYEGGIQPSVALVVDGVAVTRSNEFMIDFSDIDRIEVLNGPQGTLFGKNATAGVINVLTKRPTHRFEGSIEGTATNDEEYSARGIVNIPITEAIATRITAYYRDQSPLIKNIGPGRDAFGARAYGVNARTLFEFSPTADLVVSAGYSKLRNSYSPEMLINPISGPLGQLQQIVTGPIYGRGVTVINTNGNSDEWLTNWNISAELNWKISDSISLVSITAWRRSSSNGGVDVDATPVGVDQGVGFSPNPLNYPLMWADFADGHIHDRLTYGSQEFRLNYDRGIVKAVVGGYYQNLHERRSTHLPLVLAAGYAGVPGVPATMQFWSDIANSSRLGNKTAGVFGDATVDLISTVSVFGGLRFTTEKLRVDYHRDNYFNPVEGFFDPVTFVNTAPPISSLSYGDSVVNHNLSARAGVQWRPRQGQNYYFSYNRGFKGAAADISNQATGVNSLVKPEIGTSWELGTKQRLGVFSIDVSLYRQKIENIQITSSTPGQLFTHLVNAGNLNSKGLEFNMSARPGAEIVLSLGGAYTDAKFKGGIFKCNPVELTPPVSPACDANGLKSLTSQRAPGTPKWKVNGAIDVDHDIPGPLTLAGHLGVNWQSSVQYAIDNDPLLVEPSYATVNTSVTVMTDNKNLSLRLFVNNLFDKFYYNKLEESDFFIARSYGRLARDFKRYGGITLKWEF